MFFLLYYVVFFFFLENSFPTCFGKEMPRILLLGIRNYISYIYILFETLKMKRK